MRGAEQTRGKSKPKNVKETGVPEVGAMDLNSEPPAKVESPILAHAKKGNMSELRGVTPVDNTRVILYTSLVCIVITALAGLLAQYFSVQEKEQLIRANDKYEQVLAQLKTGETNQNLKKINAISSQIITYSDYTSSLVPWTDLLDSLGAQVPNSIRLTATTFEEETKQITLNGEGNTHSDVANVIKSLANSERFANPRLSSSNLSESVDATSIAFSIIADYIPEALTSNQSEPDLSVEEAQ